MAEPLRPDKNGVIGVFIGRAAPDGGLESPRINERDCEKAFGLGIVMVANLLKGCKYFMCIDSPVTPVYRHDDD